MLSVSVEKSLSIAILVETMDINNSDKILKELKKAASANTDKDIVINLQNVNFIDSSAIAMLVNFVKSLVGSRRKLSIVNASDQVKTAIKVLNLLKFLNVS